MEIVLPAVNEIMSKPVVTIKEDRPAKDALALMRERDIRRLPVMSEDGERLVGIVTLAEARAAVRGEEEGPEVRVVMSAPVHTARHTDLLDRAVTIMAMHKIAALPVTRYGKVVGIVTESDVFRWLAGTLDYEGQASWR